MEGLPEGVEAASGVEATQCHDGVSALFGPEPVATLHVDATLDLDQGPARQVGEIRPPLEDRMEPELCSSSRCTNVTFANKNVRTGVPAFRARKSDGDENVSASRARR